MSHESRLARRIRRALDAALNEARARGIKNPVLYFEAEGLVVLDADHPGFDGRTTTERQAAIAMYLDGAYPPRTDMGAW